MHLIDVYNLLYVGKYLITLLYIVSTYVYCLPFPSRPGRHKSDITTLPYKSLFYECNVHSILISNVHSKA